jgi:hypothetical protein
MAEKTTALATRNQSVAMTVDPYTPDTFERAMVVAENIAKSRLFGVKSKEEAFVILAAGNELGLSTMQSLRGIQVIEGKPSPTADAIVAVVLRSGLAEYFREVQTTDTESTWETKRRGEPVRRYTFTIKDAEAAGLIKPNGNWMKYRKRMLAARAKAFLGRDVYPDVLLGMITQEELRGADYAPPRDETVIEAEPVISPSVAQAISHVESAITNDESSEVEVDALIERIGSATDADFAAIAETIKTHFPKGHPDRERLATALQARKNEVRNAA